MAHIIKSFLLLLVLSNFCQMLSANELNNFQIPEGADREITPEEIQAQKEAQQALYQQLDRLLLGPYKPTGWNPPANLLESVASLTENYKKTLLGCTQDFCKYQFDFDSEQTAKIFPNHLGIEGTIIFRYPENESALSLIAYMFRADADLSYLDD